MTPVEIIALVKRLDPDHPQAWIELVRLIAEQCAQLADEATPGEAGAMIRANFFLPPYDRRQRAA